MKKIILLMFLMIPLSYAFECEKTTQEEDIPCTVTSTYYLPNNCTNYTVDLWDDAGVFIEYKNLSLLDGSNLCYWNFTITTNGTYHFNTSYGDTGFINVGDDNVVLSESINFGLLAMIVIGLATVLFIYSTMIGEVWLANFSAILYIISGVSILINGFNGLSNLITLALGSVIWGFGVYVLIGVNTETAVSILNSAGE